MTLSLSRTPSLYLLLTISLPGFRIDPADILQTVSAELQQLLAVSRKDPNFGVSQVLAVKVSEILRSRV